MVVNEQQAQLGRKSSLTPTKERRTRKPWLQDIGKGLSPASTRNSRRERRSSGSKSRSPPSGSTRRSKRFDVDSLSFSGLETQSSTQSTWSPFTTPSQDKKFFSNTSTCSNQQQKGSIAPVARPRKRDAIVIPTAFPAPDPVGFYIGEGTNDDRDNANDDAAAIAVDTDAVPVHLPNNKKPRQSKDDNGDAGSDVSMTDGQCLDSTSKVLTSDTVGVDISSIPADVGTSSAVSPSLRPAVVVDTRVSRESPATSVSAVGAATASRNVFSSPLRRNDRQGESAQNSPKDYWNGRMAPDDESPCNSENVQTSGTRPGSRRRGNLRVSATGRYRGSSPSPRSPGGSSAGFLSPGRTGFLDSRRHRSRTESRSPGHSRAVPVSPGAFNTNIFSPTSTQGFASPSGASLGTAGANGRVTMSPRSPRQAGGERDSSCGVAISPGGRERLGFSPTRAPREAFAQGPSSNGQPSSSFFDASSQVIGLLSPSSRHRRLPSSEISFGRERLGSSPARVFPGQLQQQLGGGRNTGRQAGPLSPGASPRSFALGSSYNTARDRFDSATSSPRGIQQITRETLTPRLAAPRRTRRTTGLSSARASASSLPAYRAASSDSPERTTPQALTPSESPERTGSPTAAGQNIALRPEFFMNAISPSQGAMVMSGRGGGEDVPFGDTVGVNRVSTSAVAGTEPNTEGEDEMESNTSSCVSSPYTSLTPPSPPSRQHSPYSQARTSTNSNLNADLMEEGRTEPIDIPPQDEMSEPQHESGTQDETQRVSLSPSEGMVPSFSEVVPSPVTAESELPPLADRTSMAKLHAPPSVDVETILKVASRSNSPRGIAGARAKASAPPIDRPSAASITAEGKTDAPKASPARLYLSTPTGDGGEADLSLWVTTRDDAHDAAGAASGLSSCSPASTALSLPLSATVPCSAENDLENSVGNQEAFFGGELCKDASGVDAPGGKGNELVSSPLVDDAAVQGSSGNLPRNAEGDEQQKNEGVVSASVGDVGVAVVENCLKRGDLDKQHKDEEQDQAAVVARDSEGQGNFEVIANTNEGSVASNDDAPDEQRQSTGSEGEKAPDDSLPLLTDYDGSLTSSDSDGFGIQDTREWSESLACVPAERDSVNGWEHFWKSFSRILCGFFDFCRPSSGDHNLIDET